MYNILDIKYAIVDNMSNATYYMERILYIFQISHLIIDIVSPIADGLCLVNNPHWDALYGIAWSKSKKRFVLILFIG